MTVESGTLTPRAVESMFDRIAPVYDVMNHVMTAGLDRRWRRLTAQAYVSAVPSHALFPLLPLAVRRDVPVISGVAASTPSVEWVRGDLLELPFEGGSFDAATVGFGVRNVADLERSLRELRRVLRPGGRLGILEITSPRGPLKVFYRLWFDRIVPLVGKLLRGGSAYTYLPASVRRFPGPEELAALLERAGFAEVSFRLLAGGIVALHEGQAR